MGKGLWAHPSASVRGGIILSFRPAIAPVKRPTQVLAAIAAALMLLSGALTLLLPDSHVTVTAQEEYGMDGDADLTVWGIPGGQGSGDKMGTSIAFGDFDNDGCDDMLIGAPHADSENDNWYDCGEAYVIWGGSRANITASRDMASEANVTIQVSDKAMGNGGECGHVVDTGDINGDGYDDMVLGEPLYSNKGRAYVIYGGPRSGLDGQTLSMTAGDYDVKVTGTQQGDQMGSHLAVGDIDGDGYDDVVIGAESYLYDDGVQKNNAGRAGLLFGSPTLSGSRSLTGLPMIVNTRASGSGDFFGNSITLGDWNADGYDDIFIGSYKSGSTDESRVNGGQVHLFWGNTRGFWSSLTWNLGTTPANVTFNGTKDTYFGSSLAMGDVDGDGRRDLIAGATGDAGSVHVFYGNYSGVTSDWDLMDQPANITLIGQDEGDWAGFAVASGDINDDGYDDLLVGAPKASGQENALDNAGEAYLVFGNDRASLGDGKSLGAHLIFGGNDTDDISGSAVAAGDMDGDGVDDLAIGAPGGDGQADADYNPGEAYLVFGAFRSTNIEPGVRYSGETGVFYAGYRAYHFDFNLSYPMSGGANRLYSVLMVIDPGGKDIDLRWNRGTSYEEESDTLNQVTLVPSESAATLTNPETFHVTFGVLFNWNYDDTEPQDIEVTGFFTGGRTASGTFTGVFTVENDLFLNGTLAAAAEHQGNITGGAFVRGAENITFTGLRLQYFNTPDLVPPPTWDITVTATDDDGDGFTTTHDPVSGNVTLNVTSDAMSDQEDILVFTVTDLPHDSVTDHSLQEFAISVDAAAPPAPAKVTCLADGPDDERPWSDHADDDTQVYVAWEDSADPAGGSGLAHHAMAFGDMAPQGPNSSGDWAVADGPGKATFYVRAVDNVGNWGEASSASIIIDPETLYFHSFGPSGDGWYNDTSVNASVTVTDMTPAGAQGAGVDPSSVYFRLSSGGNASSAFGDWIHAGTDDDPTGEINASARVAGLAEGVENYIQWKAIDAAWNQVVLSEPHNVRVDLSGPAFSSMSPEATAWSYGNVIDVSVTVKDGLSGVDAASVMVQSRSGSGNWSDWEDVTTATARDGAPTLTASSSVTVGEGRHDQVRWMAADIAGNVVASEAFTLKVDISQPAFLDFSPAPGEVQPGTDVTVSINITDGVSGLNTSSVAYRHTTSGDSGWGDWTSVYYAGAPNPAFFAIELPLNLAEGDGNYVQFRAADSAGTGLAESSEYQVVVNHPPFVVIDSPAEGDIYNETIEITFDGSGTTDADDDVLTFTWVSSVDGTLGTGLTITARLTMGDHIITLIVDDGVGDLEYTSVEVNIYPAGVPPPGWEDDDPPLDGDDGGGGGDKTDDSSGLTALSMGFIVAIVVMMLLMVMVLLMLRGRDRKKRVVDEAELVTDVPAPAIQLPEGEEQLQLPAGSAVAVGEDDKEGEGAGDVAAEGDVRVRPKAGTLPPRDGNDIPEDDGEGVTPGGADGEEEQDGAGDEGEEGAEDMGDGGDELADAEDLDVGEDELDDAEDLDTGEDELDDAEDLDAGGDEEEGKAGVLPPDDEPEVPDEDLDGELDDIDLEF